MFEPQTGEEWVIDREGTSVKTTWRIINEDKDRKLSHQLCRMDISDHGKKRVLEEKHVMRLWLYRDIQDFAQDAGLIVAAIYDERGKAVPTNSQISGELGNLYFVLKVDN